MKFGEKVIERLEKEEGEERVEEKEKGRGRGEKEKGRGRGEKEGRGRGEKCKTEACNNFGNSENKGFCNKCTFNLRDYGPSYTPLQFDEPKVYRKAEVTVDPSKTSVGKRTGALNKEELTEYIDTPQVTLLKAKEVAKLLKQSKHACVFTGAGVSTRFAFLIIFRVFFLYSFPISTKKKSASIPDYRSPTGVWTMKAMGKKPVDCKPLTLALPTACHWAITKLVKEGKVSAVISTNVDGLHMRTNLTEEELFELHGNIYCEKCSSCNKQYLRKFDVCTGNPKHLTGRKCEMKVTSFRNP